LPGRWAGTAVNYNFFYFKFNLITVLSSMIEIQQIEQIEQIEVRKCVLSFGAKYFIFQVAIQKFKD